MNGHRSGVLAAIAAFFLWGVLPLYWKRMDFLPPSWIVAQRTLWSLALLGLILAASGGWAEIRRSWSGGRMLGWYLLAGTLLASNWLLYVWATLNERIIEGALGYYLNPFFNMLFGVLWFGERHNRTQRAAIVLALCGVALQIPAVNGFPWVAVTLAVTFALYAVVKKRSPLASLQGLAMETLLLAPAALAWLVWRSGGVGEAFGGSAARAVLVAGSGIATTLPLLCFGHAVRRIPLTTLGILQFIGPTLQFLIGWRFYQEPMSALRLLSFGLIWAAVALYGADAFRRGPNRRGCPASGLRNRRSPDRL